MGDETASGFPEAPFLEQMGASYQYASEVCERVVRVVFQHEGDHALAAGGVIFARRIVGRRVSGTAHAGWPRAAASFPIATEGRNIAISDTPSV